MLNTSNYESQTSLNDAFELIKGIFDKERTSYEKTIKTLKKRISQLEEALVKANKENIKYQSKLSDLKGKLTTISKTVSKLEDSDIEVKKIIKENTKEESINIKNNVYNQIKYRNNEKMNSFRKKTKFITNINRSVNDNENFQIKRNLIENITNKQLNNGEDIKRDYKSKTSKPNKKSLSYKIKTRILNGEKEENKTATEQNNLFKNYYINGENRTYLNSNAFNENTRNLRLRDDVDKRNNTGKIKYLSVDKYNQIEQKIKGIKSGLNIFKDKEEANKVNDSLDNNSISINEQNIFS